MDIIAGIVLWELLTWRYPFVRVRHSAAYGAPGGTTSHANERFGSRGVAHDPRAVAMGAISINSTPVAPFAGQQFSFGGTHTDVGSQV